MGALLLTTACAHEKPKPVDIDPGDMCQSCKMAISQKKYAAEFVDKDGAVFKFDDIGCMSRFVRHRGLEDKVEAWFVVDYRTQQWLQAENATYIKSASLPSPMGSGLIAVENRADAEEYAQKYQGQILTFGDLAKE
jgi:copper chaperone NosL